MSTFYLERIPMSSELLHVVWGYHGISILALLPRGPRTNLGGGGGKNLKTLIYFALFHLYFAN